jgi:aryl-alcohol dehydrogenase-like predicted oxidoreductase
VGSTIIGATTLEQLKENIDAESLTLPDEVVSAIDAIHARYTNPGQ